LKLIKKNIHPKFGCHGDLMDEDLKTGVKINLISNRKLDSMTSQEKLRFILDEIKNGTVLVLERGLTAEEEIDLIKTTMTEIDHQTFIGIEMQSYSSDDLAADSWFAKLIGRTKAPKMSVIGPANLLKTIHKNGTMIQTMVLTGKSIVSDLATEAESEEEAPVAGVSDLSPEPETQGESMEQPETISEISAEATEQPPLATPTEEATYQDSTKPPEGQEAQETPATEVPVEPGPSTVDQSEVDQAQETVDLEPPVDAPPEIPPPPDTTLPPEPEQQGTGFLYKRLKNEEE
jgi:hypothetical protein